jgi:hypothetical protein
MNKIPKREERAEVLKLFEAIYNSKSFTVEEAHKAFGHLTPKYIKEYRNNKENKMNDTKLNEVNEEDLDNKKKARGLTQNVIWVDESPYFKDKEKQQLEFLDERVRLDFSEEENLTDNVNIE